MTKMYYNGQIVDVDESALKNRTYNDIAPVKTTQDIAPVNQKKKKKKFNLDDWLDLKNFKDGYDFGDITKSILGTGTKVSQNFAKGAQSNLEGMIDAGANYLSMGTEKLGMKKATKDLRKFAQEDFIDKHDLVNKTLINVNPVMSILNQGIKTKEKLSDGYNFGDIITSIPSADLLGTEKSTLSKKMDKMAENSITGVKSDELTQTVGQIAGQSALTSLGLPWQVTAFASSAGNEMNEAFQNNATATQAFVSGLISGVSEVGSEYLGFGGDKLLGMESLGGKAISKLGSKISNKAIQYLVKMGLGGASEGLEEVLSGFGSALGKKITYMNDKELNEIYSKEEALDEFVMGMLGTFITNIPNTARSVARGENAFTGLTENEQTVLENEVNRRIEERSQGKELTKKQQGKIREQAIRDLQKGYISADTIEETLGEKYNPEKDVILNESFNERERSKFKYYKDTSGIEDKYEKRAYETANEHLDAKNQSYELAKAYADLAKSTKTYIEFGSNQTQEFQDRLNAIKEQATKSLANKEGISLKEAEKRINNKYKNAVLNGIKVTRNGENAILLNVDSPNALNAILGHEFTHILEGTNEYQNLKQLAREYAESQNEYNKSLEDYGFYEGLEGYENAESIESEITADLVGKYVTTDEQFVKDLIYKEPTMANKFKTFIDDMVVKFTGTKEEQKLRELQKSFEKSLKEVKQENKVVDNETQDKFEIKENKEYNKDNFDFDVQEGDLKNEYYDALEKSEWREYHKKMNKVLKNTYGVFTRLDKIGNKIVETIFENGKEQVRNVIIPNENVDFLSNYVIEEVNNGKYTHEQIQEFIEEMFGERGFSKYNPTNNISESVRKQGEINSRIGEDSRQSIRESTKGENSTNDRGTLVPFSNDINETTIEKGKRLSKELTQAKSNLTRKENAFKSARGEERLTQYENFENPDAKREELKEKSNKAHEELIEAQERLENAQKALNDFREEQTKGLDEDVAFSISSKAPTQDNQGRELSKEQQEYFKDSKVRDEDGKLMEVYHGTPNDFTVFDTKNFGGANGTAEGFGIYLTDNIEVADDYLQQDKGKVMELYANITKPATTTELTTTKQDIVKAIKELTLKDAQEMVNDGDYDNINDALKDTWISNYTYTYDKTLEQAYNDVANTILEGSENDFEVLQELMNGSGNNDYSSVEDFYKVITDTLGFDGIQTKWDFKDNDLKQKNANIYIAFNSNQFKNIDNTTPTDNPDIRYSLSKDALKSLSDELGDQYGYNYLEANLDGYDKDSVARFLQNQTNIVDKFLEQKNIKVDNIYQESKVKRGFNGTKEMSKWIKDNDITLDKLANDKTLRQKYLDLTKMDSDGELYKTLDNSLDWYKTDKNKNPWLKTLEHDLDVVKGVYEENPEIDYYATKNKKIEVAKEKGFDKWLQKKVEPLFNIEQHSVEEIMDEAIYQHGTTDDYSTGAYMTTDGQLLDFNDGGYRDDHRTISAFDLDMNEFMEAGAIRMQPEGNGFEIAVEPTEAQYDRLADYIDNYLKENGDTIYVDCGKEGQSYSSNTPTEKIINDIKTYYETGTYPQKSQYSDFYQYSISKDGKLKDQKGKTVTLNASDIGDSGTLMAIHNLNESKLKGILELGGFPVPSIAILDTNQMTHNEFGDISVLFDKETINPKLRKNEVYDRDVWSPTFPRIEYEANTNVLKDIVKSLGLDDYENRDSIQSKAHLDLYQDNVENQLNSWDLDGLKETIKKNRDIQYSYLKSKGLIEPVYKTHNYNNDVSNEVLQQFLEQYQGSTDFSWNTPLNELSYEQTMELRDTIKKLVKPYLEEQYSQYGKDGKEVIKKELSKYDDYNRLSQFIYSANSMDKNGLNLQEIDEYETLKKAEQTINKEEYNKWVDEAFENIIGDKGIYNGKEIFTPMGNRRSFKATHNPVTLEALVKAMSSKETKGGQDMGIFGTGFGRISAQTAQRFNSIQDIKNSQNRLMTREEATKIIEPLALKLQEDTEALSKYYKSSDYKSDFVAEWQAMDNASEIVEEFAGRNLTVDNFRKVLETDYRFSQDIPDSVLQNIIDDLNQAKNLPTDYFEAKPQRAVGLDEIQQVVLPNTTDAEFKKQLQDAGIKYTEYNPEVDGDRQRVINQFDDLKFSLSQQNELAPTDGWNVRGQDIKYNALAPIQEQMNAINQALEEIKMSITAQDMENEINNGELDLNDLSNFNPEDINLEPFLEGLEKAEDRKNARKELKKQIEEKKSVYIPKDSSEGKGWRSFLRLFENEFAPIDQLSKDRNNPAIKHKADTFNNWVALAESNMNSSQTDINGKPIGRSGNSIIEEARKLGLENILDTYVKHWSNIDRARQSKGGADYSSKESYKIVKDLAKKHPEVKRLASEIWEYFRNARHNLNQAGIINDDLSKRLGRMYPHYVPYVSENVEQYFTENGELKPVKTIKSAKGGAVIGELLSLKEAMNRYTYSEFKGIKFNELAKEIIKSSNDEVRLEPDTRNSYVDADQLYVDKDGYYLTAYENGEPISTRINKEIYDTLSRNLNQQIKDLERQWSPVTKPLQWLSNLRRNLLTKYSPSFMLSNPIRDIGDAVVNSKYSTDFIKHYTNPNNLLELATNKGNAPQFKNLYGVANDMGQFNVDSGLFEANKDAKNFNFLKGVENINEILELAPRYAEFQASLDNGCSIEEAMYNAREVTTNFSRGGVITKALNRNGMTFLNASVQGLSKFIRNFSGENGAKGVVSSLAKAIIFGVAPSIFNDLAFGWGDDKDEDYEALPDYIKDNYYLIKMSNGEFFRIPKGRMISVFGSAGRRALEYLNGEEDAFEGFLKNADSQIGINNPEENNLFAPLIQAFGSKNGKAWYGDDIVPTRLQNVPEAEQYDEKIDDFSIWLGEKTGISPYKLNYVLDQYSGPIGDVFLPMTTKEATSDADSIGDYLIAPVKDKFIVDSTTDNKYVGDFYSTNEKLNTQANSMYATDEDILKKNYMNHISKEMSQLYAERREVQSDTTLSKKEKFARAQAIKKEINRLAKVGMDGYENIDVTGNYAVVNDDMGYYKNANGKWTSIDQDDIQAIEGMGLNDLEKSKYFDVKNELYSINKEYSDLYADASDEEKKVLSTQRKTDMINTIKTSGLPDNAKAYIYKDKYNDDLIQPLVDTGMDVDSYLTFKTQNFTADKNAKGQSISGSKKRKVFNYVNQMNIPFVQKAMLIKTEYPTYNNYNVDILEYINKSDLSYEEKMELIKKLGFKVNGNNVSW